MPDNLTQRLIEEYRKRGTAISSVDADMLLGRSVFDDDNDVKSSPSIGGMSVPEYDPSEGTTPTSSLFKVGAPSEYEGRPDNNTILNAVGVGLWSALETATFGVPGLLVDEEKFLDFEDTTAKYAGAVGGFMGFVAPLPFAPLRVGAKITNAVAKKAVTAFGKGRRVTDDVVAQMTKYGKDGKLSDEAIAGITGRYRKLSQEATMKSSLRNEKTWLEKVNKLKEEYIDTSISRGLITPSEGNILSNMINRYGRERPIQDFLGIIAERGILAARPRAQRVLAHAARDMIMFGMIDTIFEGVSVIEDHHFEWTAPVMGVVNGALFSQLSWLNPSGKSNSWMKDFQDGIAGAFGKKGLYDKLGRKKMETMAKFMGESRTKNGGLGDAIGTSQATVKYKNKEFSFNTMETTGVAGQVKTQGNDFFKTFTEKDVDNVLRLYLDKEKFLWGRELMKWSTKQEFKNMQQNWMRMAIGGVLFNASTFIEAFRHDYKPTIHDILPHFLIGAFVQRKSNPAKFDLSSAEGTKIRWNLNLLGVEPSQLNEIPTYVDVNRFVDPFKGKKWDGLRLLFGEDKGGLKISTDDWEESNRAASGKSVRKSMDDFAVVDADKNDMFIFAHSNMRKYKKYTKGLDAISVKQRDLILAEIRRVGKEDGKIYKSRYDFELVSNKENIKATQDLEQEMTNVIENINANKALKEALGIVRSQEKGDRENQLILPEHIGISPKLLKLARDGKLLWLDPSVNRGGEDAVMELSDKISGLNSIVHTSVHTNKALFKPADKNTALIKDAKVAQKLYEMVKKSEKNVQDKFPDSRDYVDTFSYNRDMLQYVGIIVQNNLVQSTEIAAKIFMPEYKDEASFKAVMEKNGIIGWGEPAGATAFLREDIKQIKVVGADNEDDAASAKRFLMRVHQLQKVSGKYDVVKYDDAPFKSKNKEGKESIHEVDISHVKELEKFLSDRGFKNLKTMRDTMYGQFTDIIIRKTWKSANMSVDEADSLFSLMDMGEAKIDTVTKVVTLSELNTTMLHKEGSGSPKQKAEEYNSWIREMSDNNGFIKLSGDKKSFQDISDIDALYSKLPSKESSLSARAQLMKFLNLLGAESEYVTLRDQLEQAARQQWSSILDMNSTTRQVIRWLQQAKILVADKDTRDFVVKMKNFTPKIAKDLMADLNSRGITPKWAENQAKRMTEEASERYMSGDHGYSDIIKNMDINRFFEKYQIDGLNLKDLTKEGRVKLFGQYIYKGEVKESGDNILNPIVINKMVKKIKYKKEGIDGWHKITSHTSRKKVNEIKDDITKLLSYQNKQLRIKKVKWDRGHVTESEEVMQDNNYQKFMRNKLNILFKILDTEVNLYGISNSFDIKYKRFDLFGDGTALPDELRDSIRLHKKQFKDKLSIAEKIGDDLTGNLHGVDGAMVLNPARNSDYLIIPHSELLGDNLKKAYNKFAKIYGNPDPKKFRPTEVSDDMMKMINKVNDKLNAVDKDGNRELLSERHYNFILKMLTHHDMFVKKQPTEHHRTDKEFIENFLNGTDESNLKRMKLHNSKKFIRVDVPFLKQLSTLSKGMKRNTTVKVIKKYLKKDQFGVGIFADEKYNKVVDETHNFIDKWNKSTKEPDSTREVVDWRAENVIGDAHKERSGYDSISYINADLMHLLHAMIGQDGFSFNPIKPVISSTGAKSSLLYGKTLFVYEPELELFFKNNPEVDILLSDSGAKVYNKGKETDKGDDRLINRSIEDIAEIGKKKKTFIINKKQLRNISLDSIGVLPQKDSYVTSKESISDGNYMNNKESAFFFTDFVGESLDRNLDHMREILNDKYQIREFIIKDLGEDMEMPHNMEDGLGHWNSIAWFAQHGGMEANPMNYSTNIVKNRLFNHYIYKIINNSRAVLNQYTSEKESYEKHPAYGSQSYLINTVKHQLRPTLVGKDGKMIMRGEVMVGEQERTSPLGKLFDNGFEMRFVRKKDVLTPEQMVNEFKGPKSEKKAFKKVWEEIATGDPTLGQVFDHLEVHKKAGLLDIDTQVGIIVRRSPRTRPNDLTILGLKGFLSKKYGNSAVISPLDMVNVFEGDLDADKVDYFFMQKKNMYDHIERTSRTFVQGIDPSYLQRPNRIDFSEDLLTQDDKWNNMLANDRIYRKSIGIVQKIPRMIQYLENLGVVDNNDLVTKHFKNESTGKSPKILMKFPTKGNIESRLVLDYEGLGFFMRSALETQYIIDLAGELNKDIASDIFKWREEFLFPSSLREESYDVNEASRMGLDALKDRRVRIFRRLEYNTKLPNEPATEAELKPLDRAVILEFLNEYANVLNNGGKLMFDKTGEQVTPKYDDFLKGGQQFATFNTDIAQSIFKKLRYKRQNPLNPKSKKWIDNPEFKEIFGAYMKYEIRVNKGDKKGGKFYATAAEIKGLGENNITRTGKTTWAQNKGSELFEGIQSNASKIASGDGGSVIDRIMVRFGIRDPMQESSVTSLTGEVRELMDKWYGRLMTGKSESYEWDADQLTKDVLVHIKDFNGKVKYLSALERKKEWIKKSDLEYKTIKKITEGIDKSIEKAKNEMLKMHPSKKWEIEKGKISKLKIVAVEGVDGLKEDTIKFVTMDNIKRILPFLRGSETFGLGDIANQDLKDIKTLRKLFYSNQTNLKDVLPFAEKTIINKETLEFLSKMPDLTEFYEIENKLLIEGMKKHSLRFIVAFMSPSVDTNRVGVYNNRVHSIPYAKNTRYNRGVQFLTQVWNGQLQKQYKEKYGAEIDQDGELQADAMRFSHAFNMINSEVYKYFNRKFNETEIFGRANRDKEFDLGEGLTAMVDDFMLPDLHKSFVKRLGDYSGIKWRRNIDKLTTNVGLTNDYLIKFYMDIMKLAGKEKQFDSYLHDINVMQEQMIDSKVIDPIHFLSLRHQMDKEVRNIAESTIEKLDHSSSDPLVLRVVNNPVYGLMGGKGFFKGLSLQKQKPMIMKDLQESVKGLRDLKRSEKNPDRSLETENQKIFDNEYKTYCT